MTDGDFLELAAKITQRSVVAAVDRLRAGQRPAPLVVDLDPTSACDLDCPECISANLLRSGAFSSSRLMALVEELIAARVAAVVLIGGGEPMLHRATPMVIGRLAEAGLPVGVVTNGTHLDRCPDELIRALDWIRVSVDAATRETYALVRPARRGNQFDRVIANIRHATRVGARRVGYSFVAISRREPDGTTFTNVGEIASAAALAKEIGCRYLEVKALMEADHAVQAVPAGLLGELRAAITSACGLASRSFAVVLADSLRALLRDGVANRQIKHYRGCLVSRLRTLVTPRGVYVCAYHRGEPAFRIGDLREQTFGDMWAAADQSVVDPSVDCPFHCARHESNLALAARLTSESDAAVDDYDLFI